MSISQTEKETDGDITGTVTELVDSVVTAVETEELVIQQQQDLADKLADRLRAHETQQESLETLKSQVKRLENESMALLHAVPNLQHRIVDSERQINLLQKEKREQQERIDNACKAHWCIYTQLWKPYLSPYLNYQTVGVTGLLGGVGYFLWTRR